MGLRGRLTLTTALVVAGIVVLASLACYLVMRGELRSQVDDQLTGQGTLVERFGGAASADRDPAGRAPTSSSAATACRRSRPARAARRRTCR